MFPDALVEITPGGGWYTEILAPYLRDKGQLILAGDDPESEVAYFRRGADNMAWLADLRAAPQPRHVKAVRARNDDVAT